MKKRFATMALALVMACSLAIPAGAANAEQTPEELYQAYLNVAAEVNAEYGTDVKIVPFEEMDQSAMPTVAEVEADVRELAHLQRDAVFEAVDSVDTMGIAPQSAMGDHTISTLVVGKVDSKTFRFMVPITLTISTSSGTPSYYIQSVSKYDVTAYTVPSGYKATAVSKATPHKSSNECTIKRTFNITKDSAYTTVRPQATFTVDKETGKISSKNHTM